MPSDHASRKLAGCHQVVLRHLSGKQIGPAGRTTGGSLRQGCWQGVGQDVALQSVSPERQPETEATGERLHQLISTHPNGYDAAGVLGLVVTCLCLPGGTRLQSGIWQKWLKLLPVDPVVWYRSLTVARAGLSGHIPGQFHGCTEPEDIWHVRTR